MDGSPDISKILGIIMENPDIIEKIKNMAQSGEKNAETENRISDTVSAPEAETVSASAEAKEAAAEAAAAPRISSKKRRHDLLTAIKPYVSAERSRAIDTMLSVVEVLEIMKAR